MLKKLLKALGKAAIKWGLKRAGVTGAEAVTGATVRANGDIWDDEAGAWR